MPDQDYHCYLLNSLSSTTKTYVGYTVNPFRRIKQHNGQIKGGARYTSRFRPWKFIAIVHGFPTSSDGLKFEWAFQNPKRSTIFRHGLNRKKNGKSGHGDASMGHSGMVLAGMMEKRIDLPGKLRLLMILLCESSYRDQPLTVYFFDEEHLNMFEDLFAANQRMAMYSDSESSCSESEEEGASASAPAQSALAQPKEKHQWCCELPSQMKCVLVEKVEELPFYAALEGQKKKGSKRKKKSNDNDNDIDGDGDGDHDNDDDDDNDNDDECLDQDQDEENRHCNIPIPVHLPAYNSDIDVNEQIDRLSIDMDASHIQNMQESEFSDDSSGTIDLLSDDDDDDKNDDKNDDNGGSDFFGDDDNDNNHAITEVNDSDCVIQMDCSTATVTTPIRPQVTTTTAIGAGAATNTYSYAGLSSSTHKNSVIDLTCGLSPMSISSPSPVPVRRGLRVGQHTSTTRTSTLRNDGGIGIGVSAPPPFSLNGTSSTYNYLDLSDDDGDYGDDGDSSDSDGTIDLCSP